MVEMPRNINEALDILESKKIVKDKQYWLDNYTKLKSTDNLILQMAEYIEPYKDIVISPTPQPIKDVYYTETKNGTRQIFLPPEKLQIDVYNNLKRANSFTKYKYAMNGTFFLMQSPSYSCSMLIVDGKILRWGSNYYDKGKPQSCIIIYKNGSVEMKRLLNVADLGNKLYSVKNLIGGIGLINKDDVNFKYDLNIEGFPSGVARKCHKSAIGYIKKTNQLVLLTRPNIYNSHPTEYDLLDLARDCEYDFCCVADGSGSTMMVADGKYKLKSTDNRGIHHVLYCE